MDQSYPIGTLVAVPAPDHPELLAAPVAAAIRANTSGSALADSTRVAEIDPGLADTAAFCAAYDIPLEISANCVVVAGKRAGRTTYAACMVLATTRADVNGVVRRHLGVRKASFAPMETAVSLTGMEYGGITPLGLPDDWPVLVDHRVAATPVAVIGSGLRRSKVLIPGSVLGALPAAETLDLAQPA